MHSTFHRRHALRLGLVLATFLLVVPCFMRVAEAEQATGPDVTLGDVASEDAQVDDSGEHDVVASSEDVGPTESTPGASSQPEGDELAEGDSDASDALEPLPTEQPSEPEEGAISSDAPEELQSEAAAQEEAAPEEDDRALTSQSEEQVGTPSVLYRAYVQGKGWESNARDGATTGSEGLSRALTSLRVSLDGLAQGSGGIEYRAYKRGKGWLAWTRDGKACGGAKESRGIEAVCIRLYGTMASTYDVWYRVYVQDIGWLAWAKNGAYAGTTGSSLRIEALQVRLVDRTEGEPKLAASYATYAFAKKPALSSGGLSVRARLASSGWLKAVGGGKQAGVASGSRRMNGLRIQLSGKFAKGITYRTYLSRGGWQAWKRDGRAAGRRSGRVEAIQILLEGAAAEAYDVYYRSYVQGIGWMAWATNGGSSGSIGLKLNVGAVQVKLVAKGKKANLPAGAYKGAAVNAKAEKPEGMTVKIVRKMGHGYKSPYYQRCIVMHDTEEHKSFAGWEKDWIKRGGVGTQFMVNRKGQIHQYADMNQICWHAGGATYAGLNKKFGVVEYNSSAGSAMNQCSIGIEMDHVAGEDYPEAQLDAVDRLIAYLDAYYGYECTILQHKDYRLINSDCSKEFQGYLRHLKKYRTTR